MCPASWRIIGSAPRCRCWAASTCYLYWNVGVAFTYKVFTLDLRYHDTDLTPAQCFTLTGDLNGLDTGAHPGRSNWCGAAFIAKLAIDTTIK